MIKKGSEYFQNKEGPFANVVKQGENPKGSKRNLSTAWFYKKLPNGEKILRSWMIYSISKQKLFCFCCRLFSIDQDKCTSKFITGFNDWWKLNPKVSDHENSLYHIAKWKTLQTGLASNSTITTHRLRLHELEVKKKRDILKRLLDIILFLAKQNLSFRGHREDKNFQN
ncbi:unnamed protein product [Brassicogethes aeneus]|uniref:TTF-type domain-containing protein n=1 Tax=Brassicogethes aeneus TaxID=1431903 RepID=A0A9P0BHA1_BRAAE|nr:unnamed protein product [Brassicogethes aeneus]